MIRSAGVFVVLLGACAAWARDKDPVKEKLATAKMTYDNEVVQFRKAVGEWFDKREDAARKAGDKRAVDQVKDDRQAFEESGELPKSAPAALAQKPAQAKKAMEAAYAEAVKAYTKDNRDDEAAYVEELWQAFAKQPFLPKSPPVDLLALVDLKVHVVSGEWKRDEKALVGNGGRKNAIVQFPYEPGEEYDIEVAVRRANGIDSFCVGLVAGGRQVRAVFDGWAPRYYACGLDVIDKKRAYENATTVKGELLAPDKDHTVVCSVRNRKIELSVNGKLITSYTGTFDGFEVATLSRVPNEKALFLFIPSATAFRIDRAVVTPVKGKGTFIK